MSIAGANLALRRRLQMMGILSINKRHRHRLSIQSVFPGLPNPLLIRNKPPAIEKRFQVWVPSSTLPLNLNWSREMNPHHILVPSNRNPQLEMKFQNLNNSVESSVTGKREGPPMIDRPFPPIRLLIPHSTNPLLLIHSRHRLPISLSYLISAGVRQR